MKFLPCVLLLLATGCATVAPPTPPARTVLLVSVDGLRADVIGTGAMPTLDALAAHGVHARWMNPSYPSLTFPNHYTLVTGLRPDHHGIVNNTMHDPVLGDFSLRNREAVSDARWWGGEPAWVTLQRHGGTAATMFWPGSEAPVAGQHPTRWLPFDGSVTANARVAQVLAWLDQPRPPRLLTLYFDKVDHAGHDHGPHSPEVRAAQAMVDAALARLLEGLEARGLRDDIDLLVVSDHGMAAVLPGQRVFLDDWLAEAGLSIDDVDVVSAGAVAGVSPVGERQAAAATALVGPHAHAECWPKAALPARWHYGTHPRVPAIVCQAEDGWRIATRPPADASWRYPDHVTGSHGYDPASPTMRAVFVADGPGFADGATLAPFDNVDVYPLLMRLLDVPARPNDGNPHTFDAVLEPGVTAAG
jgi:predicted AlkP superfamily pyrophosphatase or phosphodiesterase